MKISIVLPLIITFLAVYAMKRRRQSIAQKKVTDDFWERERQANNVRKKDISNLDYISFAPEKLPIGKYPDEKLIACENTLKELADKKMLNLSAYSNTDLKLMYGTANLPLLTECDDNYHALGSAMLAYATCQTESGHTREAIQILEYAMELSIDSSQIYLQLARLYRQNHTPDKIADIIDAVSSMEDSFQKLVLPKLEACRTDE